MKIRGEVLVELSSGQVGLSVVQGGRLAPARVARVSTRAGEGFVPGLAPLREALAGLVKQAECAGATARVIYASPDAGVGVFSCPRRAGYGVAVQAATLALGDSTSLDLSQEPCSFHPLMSDSTAGDAVSQVHTLGIASSDAEIVAIQTLVEGAGLRFEGAIPSSAVGMLSAVRSAQKQGSRGVSVVLHLGDHDATIVGVSNGRLRFVRQAPIGLETLVEALVRDPILDITGASHRLDRDAARQIILREGIPAVGQDVEIAAGVRSKAVLPVLQSTLQRLVVEAKQSSRFGLEESERTRAELTMRGVGGEIPRLGQVVTELTGITLKASPTATSGRSDDWTAWSKCSDVLLHSREVSCVRSVMTLRKNVLVGASVALVAMGFSWAKTRFDVYEIEREITSLNAPAPSGDAAKSVAEQVRVADVFLTSTRGALQTAAPVRVRTEALLIALAQAAPASLRLTSVDLDAADGAGSARVSGKVSAELGQDPTVSIGKFIDSMATSPAVKACRLSSTRRGGGEDAGMVLFELNVELVGLPGSTLATFDGIVEGPQ